MKNDIFKRISELLAKCTDYSAHKDEYAVNISRIKNAFYIAVTGYSAPELIYNRVDHNKTSLGMPRFNGLIIKKEDLQLALNFLTDEEYERISFLTQEYVGWIKDYMAMKNDKVDMLELTAGAIKMLKNEKQTKDLIINNITREQALEKVNKEFDEYINKNQIEGQISML